MQIPKNLGEFFLNSASRSPKKAVFFHKIQGHYEPILWEEALQDVRAIASAYLLKGLRRGDAVAILSENRYEWAVADLAAQSLGIATVPIYPSLTPAEIQYILADSQSKLLVLSSRAQFEKIVLIQQHLPSLQAVWAIDTAVLVSQSDLGLSFGLWKDLVKTTPAKELESAMSCVTSEDIASIIYTSGTTGSPKGVLLTHANFIHNVMGCAKTLKIDDQDRHLSFLPLCHVFERTAGYYLMIYIGASIAYAESMDTVSKNILEIRPTLLLGVPRFFEKIRDRVLEAVKKANPIKKALFYWAQGIGEDQRLGRRKKTLWSRLEFWVAERLVYRKFCAGLGGRLRFCVSGGAPLFKELAEFFYDLGVTIYEGYGLTETSPVISVNREGHLHFGTVGLPLEGVQVKIASDGEVLTKSASVMKGYHRLPVETEAVLKEGWFHTGDIGAFDPDGSLVITGRKKELIVTSGGKKISPRPIEEAVETDPFILRCVLFGEGFKFIIALIVPQKEKLLAYAQAQKIAYKTYEALLLEPKIIEYFDSRVQAATTNFASYEKIKYFALLPEDFSQAAGELTPTLKIKRPVVYSRYKELLLPFYTEKYCKEH